MKIAFFINDIHTEKDNYTTIRLARRAARIGHEVVLVGLSDLIYESDESIAAMVSRPQSKDYEDDAQLLAELQHEDSALERVNLTQFDVVLLRSDPADEVLTRPWAPNSALLFAQLLANQGVLVLNDPTHLTDASNKTYFQTYPEIVRPKTAISCRVEEIKRAIENFNGKAVIKPLQGSGGQGVFIINQDSQANLNQIIEATIRDGYAIVQEYLPLAADGDLRLITLNGRPLQVEGVYACFRRFNSTGDGRSNISAGGKYEMATPDEEALKVAEAVAPKLMRDGMYLTGLDIVGNKMMEINVDTPGGINMAEDLTGKDFSGAIIADLERKVRLKQMYGQQLTVTELAVL
ncbi:glutathione synthase [Alteromonas pelagimontana]|uniref:Glutathione synthase n=1 Tax=Alteromonas pelagimontana TaxID=1858656 RepID=A0A6M4M9B2_9ALTE|nr:glutathione synthetase [Alteromonas pelagimontana]QJR79358.1 glutathione synthase [Alteromonas pelagimontana]